MTHYDLKARHHVAKELRAYAELIETGVEPVVKYETSYHLKKGCEAHKLEYTGGKTITLVLVRPD